MEQPRLAPRTWVGRAWVGRGVAGRLAVLVGTLLVIEIGLRFALGFDPVFDRLRGQDDTSWQLEWQRARDRAATEPGPFVHDSQLGWAPRPGLDRLPVQDYRVSTTTIGARGTVELPLETPPALIDRERTRLVLLGDSFVFGAEVDDAGTLDAHLRDLDSTLAIANLGVSGYGHDQMLLRWRSLGTRLDADIVVIGYVVIDGVRNTLGFRDGAKPRFELDDGALRLVGTPVPTPGTVHWRLRLRPRLIDVVRLAVARIADRSSNFRQADALEAAILARLVEEIRESGAEPVMIHIPFRQEVIGTRSVSRGEAIFRLHCQQLVIPCRSSRPALRVVHQSGRTVLARAHLNAEGNAIVAREVLALIDGLEPSD